MKLLLLLPLLLLLSCKDSTSITTPDNTESKALITADELMRAQGGCDFIVQIPDDMQPPSMVGLAFKHVDGSIDDCGGSFSCEAGAHLRVVIFSNNKDNPRYSIIGKHGSLSGTLPSKFEHDSWSSSKPVYKVGESLIRYSTDGSVSLGSELTDDDVDLILYARPPEIPDESQ